MNDDKDKDYQGRIRHDLKNKVQITRGYLELMEDEDLPEDVENLMDKAMNAIEQSQNLLDEWKKEQMKRK